MLEGFHRGKSWAVFALLIACHVYFLQIYPHFISPNEVSRLLLTSAILDDHTLTIDHAMERYGRPQDRAFFNGHHYSDKAIGTSLLGLPALAIIRVVENVFSFRLSTPVTLFWIRLFTVTIPSLFFLILVVRFWRELRPGSQYLPHFVFLYVFGTIAFTYSSQFVSHLLLGITLFCSAYFLNECRLRRQDNPRKQILLGGLFAGLSLLLEFPAAVPVGILCIFAIATLRKMNKVVYFALPVLISVFLILGYNQLIFGTPWDVTYKHMTHSFHTAKHAEGVVGMGLPKLDALHGLLFSRHHGLFFISPFLLLSIPGFYRMSRSPEWSFLGNLFMAIVLAIILTYSAFSYWIAGWNFGPRYITPVVPFLCTAAFFFADEYLEKSLFRRAIFAATGIWSVLCVTLGTITFPFPPDNLRDPIFFLHFPLLLNGATGKTLPGNPWFFFTLLLCTLLVLTYRQETFGKSITVAGTAVALAILLFLLGFLSRPAPSAMEYYARGSVYLYLGKYHNSYSEMQLALTANPDLNARVMIQKRISDLSRLLIQQ
jgi:hypothetical protein